MDNLGVWLTIAELARRRNITRQTATEKVNRLENEGRISIRRDGRKRLVELATYDRAIGMVGDAAREMGAQTKRDDPGDGGANDPGRTPSLRDAQTERMRYDAQLKALDFAERSGQLVPIGGEHGLEAALINVTESLLRDLDAPLKWIPEIMEAAAQSEQVLRRVLREKIHDQRTKIGATLARLASQGAEAERDGVDIDVTIPGDEF